MQMVNLDNAVTYYDRNIVAHDQENLLVRLNPNEKLDVL